MEFLDVCKSRQPGGQGETAASGGGGVQDVPEGFVNGQEEREIKTKMFAWPL